MLLNSVKRAHTKVHNHAHMHTHTQHTHWVYHKICAISTASNNVLDDDVEIKTKIEIYSL